MARSQQDRINRPVTVRKKRCRDCHRTRPAEYFWRNSSSKDGLFNQCKPCAIKRQKPENRTMRPENYDEPVRKRASRGKIRAAERKAKAVARVDESGHPEFASITVVRERDQRVEVAVPKRRAKKKPKTKRTKSIRVQECRICHERLSVKCFPKSDRHRTGYKTFCKWCSPLLSAWHNGRGPNPAEDYEGAVLNRGFTVRDYKSQYIGDAPKPKREAQATAVAKVQMEYLHAKCSCCSNGHIEFLQDLLEKYKLVPKG